MRLAIITTHPIQYNAPLFRLLAKEPGVQLKVFYTWSQSGQGAKFDREFNRIIEWDIPLLEGYEYEFVNNIASDPGVHHFNGIKNPDLKEKILRWKPLFLMVIGWNFNSHLSCMRYFKGKIPVIFRGDSTLLAERAGLKKIARRLFLRWVYRHVDYALYVGKNNYDYFFAHGLQEDQLIWAPHAIDNERFAGSGNYDKDAEDWREKLGFNRDELVILFAGKLESIKDPDFMLRLAENLDDSRLRLVIVGNGKLESKLKARASRDSRMVFIDFQNQQKMPLVYRLCDIFVLPSIRETWGLAVNEAMACKRPTIVSTKCGCAPDLVESGITGWVFEPGQDGDLAIVKIIKDILDKRQELESMGLRAWKKLQPYSYATVIDSIKALMEKVIANT